MERPLQLKLLGLGGPIGTVTVDRGWTISEVQSAIVDQCRLPGWQYQLIDGVGHMESLGALTVVDATPETGFATAEITVVRQANRHRDCEVVIDALRNDNVSVLHVALASGIEVDGSIDDKGASPRGNNSYK